MSDEVKVRWGWLRFMYVFTIVGAGSFGVSIILIPATVGSSLAFPRQDPITLGITGSVYTAFALLSVLGLRSPLKFAPVLLLQLCYKVVWTVAVILPLLVAGKLPTHGMILAVIFAFYIIGDLIAIPFRLVLSRETPGGHS